MYTIALAWVNAHYNHDYELLFLGTVVIDIALINAIVKLWQ
jgi:hypothetical protein